MNRGTVDLLAAIFFIFLGLYASIFRSKAVRETARFQYKFFHVPMHLTDTKFGRNLFLLLGISFMIVGILMLFGIL